MDVSDIADQIVALPRVFHERGNVSPFSLLKSTGYFKAHHHISAAEIRAALLRSPESVREWMEYSEDKRTTSGWYVKQNDDRRYEVGYFAEDGDYHNRVQYSDRIDACVSFIKHEIEEIRHA
jgi:hypothetical protein